MGSIAEDLGRLREEIVRSRTNCVNELAEMKESVNGMLADFHRAHIERAKELGGIAKELGERARETEDNLREFMTQFQEETRRRGSQRREQREAQTKDVDAMLTGFRMEMDNAHRAFFGRDRMQ